VCTVTDRVAAAAAAVTGKKSFVGKTNKKLHSKIYFSHCIKQYEAPYDKILRLEHTVGTVLSILSVHSFPRNLSFSSYLLWIFFWWK